MTDEDGNYFMMHTGKIRGGKSRFWENYNREKIKIKTKTGITECALIGIINSREFMTNLLAFVNEVVRIKKCIKKAND